MTASRLNAASASDSLMYGSVTSGALEFAALRAARLKMATIPSENAAPTQSSPWSRRVYESYSLSIARTSADVRWPDPSL